MRTLAESIRETMNRINQQDQPTITAQTEDSTVISTTVINPSDDAESVAERLWPEYSAWYQQMINDNEEFGIFVDSGAVSSTPEYEEMAYQVNDIIVDRANNEIGSPSLDGADVDY